MNESASDAIRNTDIAIVGMACLFPGAPNLDAYWQNILGKVDAITDPPAEAWDAGVFYAPDAAANDRVYTKRGGFIGPLATFDPLAFGVMPNTAQGGEPDQWLALQIARAALSDAGYGDEIPEHERAAVILGKGTYLNRGNLGAAQHGRVVDQTLDILKTLHPSLSAGDVQAIRQELKAQLPPFNADTASGLIPNIIAGRIANRFNLMGPSFTVDGACASSLVAVEIAARNLLGGQCDMALVGGSHVVTPVPVLMLFCQLNALSRREKIRPFDKDADGTLLGEGIGMVVLKRLADAQRDGQRVYAVIKGVGVSSDGTGLSVMAPRLDGEVLALRRAYDMAGVSPRSVGLIEAHGTGTPVGDATEVKALGQVFGPRADALPWCALGSVKSMISHTMPAAGVAGLIKTALALYHKILPPTLNVETPNPELALDTTPFYLNTETRPWIHGDAAPRRAGVNAFGFGGINAHVVLEEPPSASTQPRRHRHHRWDSEVCLFSAGSRVDLLDRLRVVRQFLQAEPAVLLKDIAFTLNTAVAGDFRLAVVADTPADLLEKVTQALSQLDSPDTRRIKNAQGIYYAEPETALHGQLAFLFPGEGSQYLNMLADLCLHFPDVRRHFDRIDRVFAHHNRGYRLSDIIFPRPAFTPEDRQAAEDRLWQMEGAVEAVLTANLALFDLLGRLGIVPDALVGHSTGEYSAMLAAGMMNLDTDERLSRFCTTLNSLYRRAEGENRLEDAPLVAVAAPAERVRDLLDGLDGEVYVAMDNCPHQVVLAAAPSAAERLRDRLQAAGLIQQRLSFDRPYHTPLFAAYTEALRPFLADWIDAPPRIKTVSCTSVAPFGPDVAKNLATAVAHWQQPVRFRQTMAQLYADGVRMFVEVGPGGNLTAFVNDILRDRPHLAAPVNLKARSGIGQLNHLLGMLAVQGVTMQLDYLYRHRRPKPVDFSMPENPYARPDTGNRRVKLATGWPGMRLSDETAARLRAKLAPPPADRPANGHALRPASVPGPVSVSNQTAPPAGASPVMAAHFQTMAEFLSTQEAVMQAFLTGAPVPTGAEAVSPPDAPASPAAPPPEPDADAPPESPSGLDAGAIKARLLALVSERTGYPTDMLDVNLDMEANLGIDSIKRVEILGTFQQQTGLLQTDADTETLSGLKTLQQIVDYLAERLAPAAPPNGRPVESASPPPDPAYPFVSRVVSREPGQSVTVHCRVDPDAWRFLADHTLGRHVSVTDPTLRGLPLVPFTVMMEMMAQAAALVLPGQSLVEMRRIRANRWLAVDGDSPALEIVARRQPEAGAGAVFAQISADGAPVAEGVAVFAAAPPDAPLAAPFALRDERPSTWQADQLYRTGMFHGPIFRGVQSIDAIGADGVTATLAVGPPEGLFRSTAAPALITDPVLLDLPGQVVAFWTAECLDSGFVIFPFQLDALHVYRPAPYPAGHARCRARIALAGQNQVRSDMEVVGPDGAVWLKFSGWQDLRFDMPEAFHRLLLSPQSARLSRRWPVIPVDGPGGEPVDIFRLDVTDFPADFFEGKGGIWRRVLAHLMLNRRERDAFRALPHPPPRQLEWLLGRVAAKEAVCRVLQARYGLSLAPADIEISAGDDGRPVAGGAWAGQVPAVPRISITHSDGLAAAAIVAGEAGAELGLDVESLSRMTDDVARVAFRPAERALADDLPGPEQTARLLRFWCAKEAAKKALADSRIDGPRALTVQAFDPDTGAVRLNLTDDPHTTLIAITRQEDDRVAAICLKHDEDIDR